MNNFSSSLYLHILFSEKALLFRFILHSFSPPFFVFFLLFACGPTTFFLFLANTPLFTAIVEFELYKSIFYVKILTQGGCIFVPLFLCCCLCHLSSFLFNQRHQPCWFFWPSLLLNSLCIMKLGCVCIICPSFCYRSLYFFFFSCTM